MRFSHDRRGQSVVIGTVILFGFLILALSLYQVQVVPQQNAQTEFEHFEEVQNDLIEVRSAISTAGQSERPQFPTVKLGTTYQTRLFAINPPSPAGNLRTSPAYNITIEDENGQTENVSTRFLQYRPGYNELNAGSTWYENSVLYLDERDRGSGTVIIEDQNLVIDNETVKITALQNEFQEAGTGQVTLELYPTSDGENLQNLSGNLTVKIPTRLTGEEYWSEQFSDGSSNVFVRVENNSYEPGIHELVLNTSTDNLEINSVGIQSEPSEGAVRDNIGPAENTGTQAPPEFSSINVALSGGNNQNTNDQITFTYSTTNDATGVTLFAQTDDGTELVNDDTAPTDSSTGETYTFTNDVNMKSRNINIEMTVRNVEGDSRTCTGSITTPDGSLEKSEMQCSIS